MQSFIVLGIIPGTDIQTNLNFWIAVAIVLAILAGRSQLSAGRKLLRNYLAIRRIAYTIRHYELSLVP